MKKKLKTICFNEEVNGKKVSIKTEWKIVSLKDIWYKYYQLNRKKLREINIWNFNDFVIQNYMVSWDLKDVKLNKRNINKLSAAVAIALITMYKETMEKEIKNE